MMDNRLSAETRALVEAKGWYVVQLHQPIWLFRGERKLKNVPNPADPWSATLCTRPSLLDGTYIASEIGATANEAVLNTLRSRRSMLMQGGIYAAIANLDREIEMLTFALRDDIPF